MDIDRLCRWSTAYFTLFMMFSVVSRLLIFKVDSWLMLAFTVLAIVFAILYFRFNATYWGTTRTRFAILSGVKGIVQLFFSLAWAALLGLVSFTQVFTSTNARYIDSAVALWLLLGFFVVGWLFRESQYS